MKKFRIITALALMLSLILCLPLTAQAEEEEWREVYLDAAYKANDKQIIFDFSEPIKINFGLRTPYVDIRLTDKSGNIIGIYDKAGNRTAYYQWTTVDYQYLNEEHDKIIFTLTDEWFGCDSISDLLSASGTFPDDVKEKIEKGTYRFYVGMEEKYPAGNKELTNDGMHKNLMSEADSNVFVWPTKMTGLECVHYWLDELQPLPADIVVDESKFESMSGAGQKWDFDIMSFEDNREETEVEPLAKVTTVVKNNPLTVAIFLAVAVLVPATLIAVSLLVTKKRKAA